MKAQLPAVFAEESPARVLEKGTDVVRSVYGSHCANPVFGRLVRDPRVLEPAMRILESEVYVHQFKSNAKQAFGGEVREWHQDYIFWRNEDGMPTPGWSTPSSSWTRSTSSTGLSSSSPAPTGGG